MTDIGTRIDTLLKAPPFGPAPFDVFELLRDSVLLAAERHAGYANYVRHWPVHPSTAASVADLPYLPVQAFKADPPLALVAKQDIHRVMMSSSTTGQMPSRIALDSITARRLSAGTAGILADAIGKERRPFLVIDCRETLEAGNQDLGARAAAIRGLMPFSRETTFALAGAEMTPDLAAIREFVEKYRDEPVVLYGFTWIVWSRFLREMEAAGQDLGLAKAHVLHSGGWKRLTAESVDKPIFNARVGAVVGCPPENVIDYYGMVENLGVIYPDCSHGHKHVPTFGGVIVRDPLTLEPAALGETGLLQVMSVLPSSFPGHLLLTEDLGTVVLEDGCPCSRPGPAFRFVGRAPAAEIRGCGDILAARAGNGS